MRLALWTMAQALALAAAESRVVEPHELGFQKNRGQGPANAEFLGRFAQTRAAIGGAQIVFNNGVRFEWIGAAAHTSWEGLDPTGNRYSYYRGAEPSKWVRNIESYRKIRRQELYPGVDLDVYISAGNLEYDLILKPGADPTRIRLRVTGTRALLEGAGSLRAGDLRQDPPVAFQTIDGARYAVRSRFVALGDNEFGLELGQFRRDLPLVVDPVIRSAWAVMGSDDDRIIAVTEKYVVGVTRSADWGQTEERRGSDLFIRYELGFGSTHTMFWGGEGDDEATAAYIQPGALEGITIVGWTSSRQLPVREANSVRTQSEYGGGESDGFLLQLFGDAFHFATYVGGAGSDRLNAVTGVIGSDGWSARAFAGETDSLSWPPDVFVAAENRRGGTDALIGRLLTTGPAVAIVGGAADDRAAALVALETNTFAIAGETNSDDFALVASQIRKGSYDVWFTRMQWVLDEPPAFSDSAVWGGTADDHVATIVNVALSGLYVFGTTSSDDFPILNAVRPALAGRTDGFIVRLSPDGKRLLQSTYLGGAGDDRIYAAAARGPDILVAGSTTSADFPGVSAGLQDKPGGGTDGLIAHLDPDGRAVWSALWGGESDDALLALHVSGSDPLRVGGISRSRNWLRSGITGLTTTPPNPGDAKDKTADAFVADIEYSVAMAPEVIIGKDLQAALPLTVISEQGADGILIIRSTDPSRLLVSLSPVAPGAEQVTLFESLTSVTLQALASEGDVDLVLSGRYYPERRVRVRLTRSALFVRDTESFVSFAFNAPRYETFSVRVAPLDPETGLALAPQQVRAGLDAKIRLVSSDENGLKSSTVRGTAYDNVVHYPFTFEILREGSYTLTPSSPVIPTADDQRTEVTVSAAARAPVRMLLARDARAILPIEGAQNQVFRVTSEDPSKLLVADPRGGTPQPSLSITLSWSSGSVYVDALASEGSAGVVIEGPNGFRSRALVTLAPLEVELLAPQLRVSPRDRLIVRVRAKPVGSVPARHTVPAQWLSPDGAAFKRGAQTANPAVLSYDGVQFDGSNLWQYYFTALQPGSSDIYVSFPEHAVARINRLRAEVVPPTFRFERAELIVGERLMLLLNPTVSLPPLARRAVKLTIADPAVATLSGSSIGEAASVTANFERWPQIFVVALGRAGQTTTLTVSAEGLAPVVIPVRIVPTVLVTPDGSPIRVIAGPSTRPPRTAYGTGPSTRVLTGDRVQTTYSVPYGMNEEIILLSRDPSRVRLSLRPEVAGSDRVTLPAGGGSPDRLVYFQGFASEGSATVTAFVQGGGSYDITVHLFAPTLAVHSPLAADKGLREVRFPASGGNIQLTAAPGLIEPVTGAIYLDRSICIRAGAEPFLARGISSDPEVAEPQPPTPLFSEGSAGSGITFSPKSAGVTDLSVTQPDGFVNVAGSSLRLRVYRPSLTLSGLSASGAVLLSKDLQAPVTIIDPSAPYASREPFSVTVTSLDPEKVLVSASVDVEGQQTLVIPFAARFYIQAVSGEGRARLKLEAAGYEDSAAEVELVPAAVGFTEAWEANISAGGGRGTTAVYAPLERNRVLTSWHGMPRPGVRIPVRLRSFDPSIVEVQGAGEALLSARSPQASFSWRGLRPGSTELQFELPPDVPSLVDRLPVVVERWKFSAYVSGNIGRYLTASISVYAPNRESTTVRAQSSGTTPVLLSLERGGVGQPSITLTTRQSSEAKVYVEPMGPGNAARIALTAEDFEPAELQIEIAEPAFAFGDTGSTGLQANLSAGTVNVPVLLGVSTGFGTVTEQPLGSSRGTVRVELRSSNPQVVRLASETLDFRPGESSRSITLQLVGRGEAVISLQAPGGFNLPSGRRDLLVTVR